MQAAFINVSQQNPFYTDQSFPSAKALNQYPFHAVLVPSDYTQRKLLALGVSKPFYVVYPFIDEQFFPRPKTLQIAYSARKRADDLQIFNFYYRSLADDLSIPFVALNDLPREKVAEILGESAIYLATAKRESLGLMNLEAMASGCRVVGFSGFTDDECIFNATNGDWVKEGEYQLLVEYLLNAIGDFKQNRSSPKIATAHQLVESRFRRVHFEQQAKVAWSEILGIAL